MGASLLSSALSHSGHVLGKIFSSSFETSSEEINEVFGRAIAARQIVHEHHLDVGRCEYRFADLQTLACEEEHGHHDQGGVVMPSSPPANLILAEATLLFRVLQGALDEVALTLHVCEPLQGRFRSSVRQAVLEAVRLSRHDQVLLVCLFIAALEEPHPTMQYLHIHRALCSVS